MTLERIGPDLVRWVDMLAPSRSLAEVIAETDFVPRAMRGKPDAVCAAIMYGDELGLGPMQSLAGIAIIEGRPQITAELMRAMVFRAGHSITVHESTGQKCRVSGLRAGRPESERAYVEWTHDMAKAAGLVSKQNWRAYPRAMLIARATSDLARILFPDVVKGMSYIAEDDSAAMLESEYAETGPAPVAPPLAPPQRKRRPSLPSPGRTIATEEHPGPDGSVDVPLPAYDVPTVAEAAPVLVPDPDPADEPPAPGQPVVMRPMAPPAKKALQASLGKVLGKAPREERLAALGAILGREILTSDDLSRDEGYRVLGFLDRVQNGQAGLVKRSTGWEAVVYDLPVEEPPDDPWGEP